MTKLTKAELIEKVELLESELKEREHLASAVNAKDDEIAELKAEHREEIRQKEEAINRVYAKQDKRIDEIEYKHQKEIELIYETLQKREKQLNKLVVFFGNTLKGLQGNLDNAIELNSYFVEEVSSDGRS